MCAAFLPRPLISRSFRLLASMMTYQVRGLASQGYLEHCRCLDQRAHAMRGIVGQSKICGYGYASAHRSGKSFSRSCCTSVCSLRLGSSSLWLWMLTPYWSNAGASCVTPNGTCAFPFTYDTVTYKACTNLRSSKFWCSLTPKFAGERATCPDACLTARTAALPTCPPRTFGKLYTAEQDPAWMGLSEAAQYAAHLLVHIVTHHGSLCSALLAAVAQAWLVRRGSRVEDRCA